MLNAVMHFTFKYKIIYELSFTTTTKIHECKMRLTRTKPFHNRVIGHLIMSVYFTHYYWMNQFISLIFFLRKFIVSLRLFWGQFKNDWLKLQSISNSSLPIHQYRLFYFFRSKRYLVCQFFIVLAYQMMQTS